MGHKHCHCCCGAKRRRIDIPAPLKYEADLFEKTLLSFLHYEEVIAPSNRYIEAINGARRLRTELYDKCGPYEFVEEMEERKKVQGNFYEQYVLDLWWEAAHNYSDPAIPKVYSW